jgi:toxin-antitoxin system PIN domain toxin
MMLVPDVNLLIYAYDSRSPWHDRARSWWEVSLAESGTVGIPWVVVLAFTRLMTHPTLSENPMTVEEVRERVDGWLALPQTLLLVPREGTLRHMFDLLGGVGAGGNLSTDALIAAHALEHGGVVCSNDHDFGRFNGVRWINPLTEE